MHERLTQGAEQDHARPKPPQPKPAIRLDDLIPNEKVLGGQRVIFGVRAKPLSKS